MTKKWSSRLTFFAFVVLMVGLGSNDSLRGIFFHDLPRAFLPDDDPAGADRHGKLHRQPGVFAGGRQPEHSLFQKRVLQVLILI